MTGTAATLLRLELRPAPASGGLLGKNATIGLCLVGSASLCRLMQDMQPCCFALALHRLVQHMQRRTVTESRTTF